MGEEAKKETQRSASLLKCSQLFNRASQKRKSMWKSLLRTVLVGSAEVTVKSLQGTGTYMALGFSLLISFYARTENDPQGEYS